jgi:outer membrane protein OmpA-like peptidoglycan-associated protein
MDVTDHQFAAAAPTFYRDPKLASVFTERYKNLEVQAAQEVRLGVARRGLAQAIKNGAADYAPQTLKQARGALKRAEDAIAFDPRHQSSYAMEVTQARRAVRWLTAVNSTARATAHRTDEQIAADLIAQNRNLHDLRTQLHGSELESELKGRALTAKEMELRQVNSRLENEKEIQRTIAAVREKFGQDEANVYRDGDKLLIQLKKMDFKSGSAALPDDSRPLLSKVKAIIRDVHAKDVVVQGHADGTGSVKANQHVSEARAEAVADYIEDETGLRDVSVVGLGENRPLRSNKTASGRAVNRRVDLVITPALSEP